MEHNSTKLYEFKADTRKILVAGDLHGEWNTFRAVKQLWEKENHAYLLFLGDYGDRGEKSLEILDELSCLIEHERVVALKGNHEDYSASGDPLFTPCTLISEADVKRGGWFSYFQNSLKPLFNRLYMAALWPGRILFVHGGISSRIKDKTCLIQPSLQIEKDLLWSDPVGRAGEFPNSRGAGVEFGPDISEKVLTNLGVETLIRSHQPYLAKSAPFTFHEGRVITISSTGVFGGQPYFLEIENTGSGYSTHVRYIS